MNIQFSSNTAGRTSAATTFNMYVLVRARGGADASAVDAGDRAALGMHQVKVASHLTTDEAAQSAWAQLNGSVAIASLCAVEVVAIDPRSMTMVPIAHEGGLPRPPRTQPVTSGAGRQVAIYILIQPKADRTQALCMEDRKSFGMHKVRVPDAMPTDEACVFAWYVLSHKLAISNLRAVQVVGIDPRTLSTMYLSGVQSEIEHLARTREELTLA